MLDGSIISKQEYIKNSNELNKGVELKTYLEGNKKKVELEQKLDELSIKTGTIVSGNVVRQNIISSSASKITTINNFVDNQNYVDPDKERKKLYEEKIINSFNRGKEIMNEMKKNINNNSNNTNSIITKLDGKK